MSIDLRGLGPQLRTLAAKQGTTTATLTRKALRLMFEGRRDLGVPSDVARTATGTGACVKVTLRLSAAHAASLAVGARAADMAQGAYVSALMDGIAPAPLPADHARAVEALVASTNQLAATSADLNAFMRLLGRVPAGQLEPYRAGVGSLAKVVREHLAAAARLIAELKASRRGRR
ncbi:hypothetical protein ACG02S_02215 [Roseateles sp. DC23W]|uniref:Ribbon-helix-helix protein, copG family n=1 Tax=Pelomonas dachongensis TaxID=3299029 RepID=A0ABW7EHC4_9BURK